MSRFYLGLFALAVFVVFVVTGRAKKKSAQAGLALVVAVLLAASACIRVVPANTVGIPTQFGAIGKPLPSGFHLTLPWTEVSNFSTRVQELSMLHAVDEGDLRKDDSIEIISRGGGSMRIDVTVRYYVEGDLADTLFRQAGTMGLIKDTFVRPDTREVVRNVFSSYTAEDGYSTKRAEISASILEELAPRLKGRGIVVDSVNIRDVQPEDQVLSAINSILQSRNDALKAAEDQKKQVTEAETRKQVAERDKESSIIKAQADAEAIRISAEAQAVANRGIATSLTPELTRLKAIEASAAAIAATKAAVVSTCGESASAAGSSSGGVAAPTVVVDTRPR